jgi:hypothetical protein
MNSSRVGAMAQTVFLAYVLVLAGLLIHEGIHLVVLSLLGKQGIILVVPWRLGSVNYYIHGLHVQPTEPLDLVNHVLFDFLGPALAALPFAFLAYYVKERIPRTALIANIIILLFFAILETAYEFLESTLHREIGILGSPEISIGISLIIILIVAYKRIVQAQS